MLGVTICVTKFLDTNTSVGYTLQKPDCGINFVHECFRQAITIHFIEKFIDTKCRCVKFFSCQRVVPFFCAVYLIAQIKHRHIWHIRVFFIDQVCFIENMQYCFEFCNIVSKIALVFHIFMETFYSKMKIK